MLVTLYTKPGCHLCSELKADLSVIRRELDVTIIERNIEENEDDFARFRYLIPVLDIAGGPTLFPPHAIHEIRQALRAANPAVD